MWSLSGFVQGLVGGVVTLIVLAVRAAGEGRTGVTFARVVDDEGARDRAQPSFECAATAPARLTLRPVGPRFNPDENARD
jgi:hypothetical protein